MRCKVAYRDLAIGHREDAAGNHAAGIDPNALAGRLEVRDLTEPLDALLQNIEPLRHLRRNEALQVHQELREDFANLASTAWARRACP